MEMGGTGQGGDEGGDKLRPYATGSTRPPRCDRVDALMRQGIAVVRWRGG
jgi:hypothetical protein